MLQFLSDIIFKTCTCTFSARYIQECIAETQDWRKCQEIVKEFKSCMQLYTNQQRAKYQK